VIKPIWLTLVLGLFLTGCGGAQEYAGINFGKMTFSPDGMPLAILIAGGKESSRVELTGETGTGLKFSYTATDLRAFEAHAIRAEVEKALIETIGNAAPGVVDSLTSAILKVIAP
jgi:hypothetical protein